MLSNIPLKARDIALSGEHRAHQEGAPKPYKPEQESEFRGNLLQLARQGWILHLSTLAPDGWPVTHCTQYVTFAEDDDRPVLYILADPGTRELFNVGANPRVSMAIYNAVSFERRREAAAVQIQALASVAEEPEQGRLAREAFLAKYPALHPSDLASKVVIRIDCLSAVNFFASAHPQWGTLDYLPEGTA